MGLGLSGVVGCAAALHGGMAVACARAGVPRAVTASLAYCSVLGAGIAVASHDSVNATWALGKDPRSGALSPLSELLALPYHVPVRLWAKAKRHVVAISAVDAAWAVPSTSRSITPLWSPREATYTQPEVPFGLPPTLPP